MKGGSRTSCFNGYFKSGVRLVRDSQLINEENCEFYKSKCMLLLSFLRGKIVFMVLYQENREYGQHLPKPHRTKYLVNMLKAQNEKIELFEV